jgi:hypothetical protein
MKNLFRTITPLMLFLAAALTATTTLQAQDLHPSRRPSPTGIARITLDDTYVKVVYSRPYKRGRDNIFGTEDSGALVPYGNVWRTGANEATEITLTGDLMVADQLLPAGTYSVFTVPGPEEWTVHFNSALGLSGTGRFEDGQFTAVDLPASEVLKVSAKSGSTEEEVDQFTIAFEPVDDGAHLVLSWINTEVRVPISPAG